MKLPPQAWMKRPGAKRILAALDVESGTTRLVGGAVRDALLGHEVSDIDLATRLSPEAVVERLEAAGIKAVPTGIAHGTVTAVANDSVIEVTTLRRDVATDGRRATIAYTDDWREDAARRDFTINALYANPFTGAIDDFFGGLDDLAARRLRFIGEPLQRIAEDHLRILRFFRFHARFGSGEPDEAGLFACTARANDLMALSRERIRDELLKLLCVKDPVPTLRIMLERGILAPVLPEIRPDRLETLDRLVRSEAAAGVPAHPLRRLAALLPPDPVVADDIGARLRLSNAERKRLVAAAGWQEPLPSDPRQLAYAIGAESAVDRMLLAGSTNGLPLLAGWQKPRLPVSGRDLIQLGLSPGPAVSRALGQVEQRWIEAGFPADRAAVLTIARDVVAQAAN